MSDPFPEELSGTPITVASLAEDLRDLGVQPGDTLLVHASLSALGWVWGGAPAVVDALQVAVTPGGTLVMPTHTPGNRDPAEMTKLPVPEEWYETIRDQLTAYRPAVTPTWRMGAIAECFRSYPSVRRSAHPRHSFAAWGARAEPVVADHSLDHSLGEGSPLARVYDLDGSVLMLGVDHATNTSLHLAEQRADIGAPTKTCRSVVERDGSRRWVDYEDISIDADDFPDCGESFERERPDAVARGVVGDGEAILLDQSALVDFGTEWLEANRD